MEDQPKKKKPYSKPEIEFFPMQMSTSISAGCEVRGNFNEGSCGANIGGATNVFMMGVSGCSPIYYNQTINGQYFSTCYRLHEGNNVFNS